MVGWLDDDRCQLVIKSLENSIQLICVGEVMKLTKGIMGMTKEQTWDVKRGKILTVMMIFVVGKKKRREISQARILKYAITTGCSVVSVVSNHSSRALPASLQYGRS